MFHTEPSGKTSYRAELSLIKSQYSYQRGPIWNVIVGFSKPDAKTSQPTNNILPHYIFRCTVLVSRFAICSCFFEDKNPADHKSEGNRAFVFLEQEAKWRESVQRCRPPPLHQSKPAGKSWDKFSQRKKHSSVPGSGFFWWITAGGRAFPGCFLLTG